MKITIWGINYSPEVAGIAPYNTMLAEFLKSRGHGIDVVTTFAYYPAWRKLDVDCQRFSRRDVCRGIPVYRCWTFVPRKPSTLTRIVHEASFVVTSFLRLCLLCRPDFYIVVSPPLLLGLAAWLLGVMKKAPFVFHVQDLQPDAAVGLGMLRKGLFVRLLYGLERFAYEKAARVSGISPGMLCIFEAKGIPSDKTVYFPNGIDLPELDTTTLRGVFRKQHGIASEAFLAVYSGNLGIKQGLDILLEAAQLLNRAEKVDLPLDNSCNSLTPIKILICGDGARRDELAVAVRERGLSNVLFLPLQSSSDYKEMLTDADCCLITQQQGTGAYFFPSKLLAALAYGKPVVTVADAESELVRGAVAPGGFGINVLPGRPDLLADALRELARAPDKLARFGTASRRFAEQFDARMVLANFEQTLLALTEESSQGARVPIAEKAADVP